MELMMEMPQHYTKFVDELRQMVETYMETGVAVIGTVATPGMFWRQYAEASVMAQPSQRKFIKKIARELKRRVIYATRNNYSARNSKVRIDIKMPRREYTAGIALGYYAAASHGGATNMYADLAPGIYATHDFSNWYVSFVGPQAEEWLAQLLERARTDPDYRRAMKLPTEVSDARDATSRKADRATRRKLRKPGEAHPA